MSTLTARGSLLETVRLSRELTQMYVANATGISQATLSKVESGTFEIDPDKWRLIAQVLGVPVEAFETATSELYPARIFHRKRKTTPLGAVKKIGADLALTGRRIDDLLGAPRTRLKRHDLEDGFVTPQEIAAIVRNEIGAGSGPIDNLTGVIEAAGVWILRWPLDTLQVDAIASWPEDAAPVILIGDHVAPERLRFTMAHEIGHAVMHDSETSEAQEREADAFAGELLLPSHALRNEWPTVPDLDSFIELKRRWGVSLSALIRRAFDTALLDENQYRDWSIRLSTSGMHRREPAPLDAEQPRALANAVAAAISTGSSIEDLAARAHMDPLEFESIFLEEAR